jgi:hypothetical protein
MAELFEIPTSEFMGCTAIRQCDGEKFTILALIPPMEGGGLLGQPRWILKLKRDPTQIFKIEFDNLAANYIIKPPPGYEHLIEENS